MNPEIEKIHSRIRKLQKLQEGASAIGSMEEAANAAAQIQKLLFKHNLDLNQIEPEKVKDRLIISKFEIGKKHGFRKTESDWLSTLLNVICVNNMCKSIRMNKSTMYEEGRIDMRIIGEPSNIEVVTYLFDQLVATIKYSRRLAFKQAEEDYPGLKRNGYFRSYSKAFCAAIAEKLHEQQEANKVEYTGGSALMVINNEALEKKAAEQFGRLTSSKSRSLKNVIGALHGKRDGDKAQIHQGLKGENNNTKIN